MSKLQYFRPGVEMDTEAGTMKLLCCDVRDDHGLLLPAPKKSLAKDGQCVNVLEVNVLFRVK